GQCWHGWDQCADSGAACLLHVRWLEALRLWGPEPARPGRCALLYQDQDRHLTLALRGQGRRRVRHSDDEIKGERALPWRRTIILVASRPAWAGMTTPSSLVHFGQIIGNL